MRLLTIIALAKLQASQDVEMTRFAAQVKKQQEMLEKSSTKRLKLQTRLYKRKVANHNATVIHPSPLRSRYISQ